MSSDNSRSLSARCEGGCRLRGNVRVRSPLVSIVIVVFQARDELLLLLQSVVMMQGDDVELIVVDGGSDDGTISLLREFEDSIDYWISEPDSGIYDAMNKGIAAATGEYIWHLNAGDRLRYVPKRELKRSLIDGIDVCCFAVEVDGRKIRHPRTGIALRFMNTWHHQGTFYKRENLFPYNTRYRIYGDFDLNQRMAKAGKSVRLSDTIVAEVIGVGVSGNMATYKEQYEVIGNNFGIPYVCLARLWRYTWPLVHLVKRWLRRAVAH